MTLNYYSDSNGDRLIQTQLKWGLIKKKQVVWVNYFRNPNA